MDNSKNLAIKLRRQGKSYNQIVKILGTPKSTLSLWLRDIDMSPKIRKKFWDSVKQRQAESITKFNKKQAEKAREKAQEIQKNAYEMIGAPSKKELLLMGAALYWAEGFKKTRWILAFSNSDPLMIKVIMKFFREICNVPEEKMRGTVQIHPNVTPEQAINYWSKITKIPQCQFSKCYTRLSPSSKQKRPYNTLPYGTLRISVYDSKITNKVKGWIQGISEKI
ncbi:MAG: helix-turn-helix domain-containing protein [Patescibacteria group bacterium]